MRRESREAPLAQLDGASGTPAQQAEDLLELNRRGGCKLPPTLPPVMRASMRVSRSTAPGAAQSKMLHRVSRATVNPWGDGLGSQEYGLKSLDYSELNLSIFTEEEMPEEKTDEEAKENGMNGNGNGHSNGNGHK